MSASLVLACNRIFSRSAVLVLVWWPPGWLSPPSQVRLTARIAISTAAKMANGSHVPSGGRWPLTGWGDDSVVTLRLGVGRVPAGRSAVPTAAAGAALSALGVGR